MEREEYNSLLRRILKGGLKPFKGTKIAVFGEQGSNKTGAIAGYQNKESLTTGVGTIYRTLEQLLADSNNLTHWTPNVFSWLGGGNGYPVYGHSESNLIQINTFAVDIDFPKGQEKISINQLRLYLISQNLLPTIILDTPKGYHVYFFIENENTATGQKDKACYVSSANDYKSLKVVKRISENIRFAIKEYMPEVDMGCNHFGVFRFPTQENIVHFEPSFVDTFSGYMDWSIRYEKQAKKRQKSQFSVLGQPGRKRKGYKQTDAKWYRFIKQTTILPGNRNQTVFTMALACKQSGLTEIECEQEIADMEFYGGFSTKEISRSIQSAYKGNYRSAKGQYINEILSSYTTAEEYRQLQVASEKTEAVAGNGKNGRVDPEFWYKFKKSRKERTYSHFDESQEDLLAFLTAKQVQQSDGALYLTMPMKDIADETKIPLSTLKVIFKQLQQKKVIVVKSKKGRGGYTKIATKKYLETRLMIELIERKKNTMEMPREQRKALIRDFKWVVSCFKPEHSTVTSEISENKHRRERAG